MVHVSTSNFCLKKVVEKNLKFVLLLSKHLKEVAWHSQDWPQRCGGRRQVHCRHLDWPLLPLLAAEELVGLVYLAQ